MPCYVSPWQALYMPLPVGHAKGGMTTSRIAFGITQNASDLELMFLCYQTRPRSLHSPRVSSKAKVRPASGESGFKTKRPVGGSKRRLLNVVRPCNNSLVPDVTVAAAIIEFSWETILEEDESDEMRLL